MLLLNFISNRLLFLYLGLTTLVLIKSKVINLIFINTYGGCFVWKMSQILNTTHLNVIAVLFIVIIFLEIYNISWKKKLFYKLLFVLYVVVTFNNLDYSLYSGSFFNFYKKLNIGLLNGLLVIHPWLIFILYGIIILSIHIVKFFSNPYRVFFFIKFFTYKYFFLASYAILLGSWWSYQELSWGGWWNWDIIELISLNVFFFVLLLIHSGPYVKFFKQFTLIKFIVIFLASVIIVRFNLLSSIHAFTNTNMSKIFFIRFFLILMYFSCLLGGLYKIFTNSNKLVSRKKYLLYFNINMFIIFFVVGTYLVIFLFFKNEFVELNGLFEFFFLYLFIYFTLSFINLKSIGLGLFSSNFFLMNYMFFFLALITSSRLKNLKHFLNTNFRKHYIVIILFSLFYFLKIYFTSISIFEEYCFGAKDCMVGHGRNFCANTFLSLGLNNHHAQFIYVDAKINDLGEFKVHYYKNFLLNLYSCFIKIVKPNANSFLLFYKNIFIFLLIGVGLIFYFTKSNKLFLT